jgi:hypothetical protein
LSVIDALQVAETDESDPAIPGALLVSEIAKVVSTLDQREQAFLDGLIEGLDADSAANAAGWKGRLPGAKVLGRPRIRQAIQVVAPYLPVKVGARLIAPYVLERLTGIALQGSDAQSLHAARDLLNLAGLGPVSRSESVTASLSDVLAALDRRRTNEPIEVAAAPVSKPARLRD